MTRFYVTPDADGTPVLWGELGGPDPQMVACRDGDRIHVAETQADRIWTLLTSVLAPDEATVERLARALFAARSDAIGLRITWANMNGPHRKRYLDEISTVLAALTDTRDTDTEAVSGNG